MKLIKDSIIIIMNINMPEVNGVEATHQIVKAIPEIKVLGYGSKPYKYIIDRMFKVGASGFMTKSTPVDHLKEALDIISTGEIYLCPDSARIVIDSHILSYSQASPSYSPLLTEKEYGKMEAIRTWLKKRIKIKK